MPRLEGKLIIYNRIQELRLEKNLTQQDLADSVQS